MIQTKTLLCFFLVLMGANAIAQACPFCGAPGKHEQTVLALEAKLLDLQSKFGPQHPEVVRAKRELDFLRRAGLAEKQVRVQGMVTAISKNPDVVEISIGSDDGVKEGDEFEIARFMRNAMKVTGDWIGRIKITTLAPDKAVGTIEIENVEIKKGDQILQLFRDEIKPTSLAGVGGVKKPNSFKIEMRHLQFEADVDVAELALFLEKLFDAEGVRIAAEPQSSRVYLRGQRALVETADATARQLCDQGSFKHPNVRIVPNAPSPNLGIADRKSVEQLRAEYQQLESTIAKFTKIARQTKSKDALSVLKSTVQKAFEVRQKLQAAEVQQHRQRLAQIEARIARRQQLKNQIVDKRIDELLEPDLKWDAATGSAPPPAGKAATTSNATLPQAFESATQPQEIVGGQSKVDPKPGAKGNPQKVQVKFTGPEGMQVFRLITDGSPAFKNEPLICPGRLDFAPGNAVKLKLAKIEGREGVQLFPTLEVRPITDHTRNYLAHNAIVVQFTAEDFDQVQAGNFVTKVVYLPKPEFQELALAGIETLVSTRLDPGTDPVKEAELRGYIFAVIRMGNREPEKPAAKAARGKVVFVDKKAVWINLGMADGIKLRQRFTVVSSNGDEPEVSGTIEVTRILDKHISECRVVSEELKNPVLPNNELIPVVEKKKN